MNSDSKPILAIFAAIAFFGDIVFVVYSSINLLFVLQPLDIADHVATFILLFVVFAFAAMLMISSGPPDSLEWLFQGIAWVYIAVASLMLIEISYLFLIDVPNVTLGEWLGSVTFPFMIAALGVALGAVTDSRTRYYGAAFVIVAIGQIMMWVAKLLTQGVIPFDSLFVGNLIIFMMNTLIIAIIYGIDVQQADKDGLPQESRANV